MYENNNTVSIDWKGLFIKLIIVAVLVFAIFKGYEYFSNNKNSVTTNTTTNTQLFNANLESLRQAGENYFNYSNYPSEGQTAMVTLAELTTKGNIKELYDENGNECNRESSYVSVTNDGGKYKLKASLSCAETSNYTVVMIGCECEGDECTQAIKTLENNNSTSKSNTNSSSNSSSSNNSSSSKSSSSNNSNNTNSGSKKNNTNTNTNSNVNNTTTNKKTTKRINLNDENTTTTKITTTQKSTVETTYKVEFYNDGSKVDTQYVVKNGYADEPDDAYRRNARFVGWYTSDGELYNFNNRVTRNIKLYAYFWETDTITTTVYSAAYDTYGTTYVTVEHKLAVPSKLQKNNVKNVRISNISNKRSMYSANDLYNHSRYHSTTFEGYIKNGSEYSYDYNAGYTLGSLYNIRVNKSSSYTYDRWITWSAYVGNQCANAFDGYNCNYGIVYNVEWEYDILTD